MILKKVTYALKMTATENADKFPKAAQRVRTSFYMDEYLESSPTDEETPQKAKDVVELLSVGGFNLSEFVPNDPNILQQIELNSECQTNATIVNCFRQQKNHHTYLASNGTTTRIHLLLAEAPLLTQTEMLLNELPQPRLRSLRTYWARSSVHRESPTSAGRHMKTELPEI